MYKSLVFGDEFLAQGLHLKSHQKKKNIYIIYIYKILILWYNINIKSLLKKKKGKKKFICRKLQMNNKNKHFKATSRA